jgi:hypothetical protein
MRSAVLAVLPLGPASAVAVFRRRPEEPHSLPFVGLLNHRTGWIGEPDTTPHKQTLSLLVEPLPPIRQLRPLKNAVQHGWPVNIRFWASDTCAAPLVI